MFVQKQSSSVLSVAHSLQLWPGPPALLCCAVPGRAAAPLRLRQLADCSDFPSPGVVAGSCNPATRRQVLEDGLRRGLLVVTGSCWSGVRTKACINMDPPGELGGVRLSNEGRTGPGGKPSSQESPCESVVGPRWWVAGGYQPLQHSQTQNFLQFCKYFT